MKSLHHVQLAIKFFVLFLLFKTGFLWETALAVQELTLYIGVLAKSFKAKQFSYLNMRGRWTLSRTMKYVFGPDLYWSQRQSQLSKQILCHKRRDKRGSDSILAQQTATKWVRQPLKQWQCLNSGRQWKGLNQRQHTLLWIQRLPETILFYFILFLVTKRQSGKNYGGKKGLRESRVSKRCPGHMHSVNVPVKGGRTDSSGPSDLQCLHLSSSTH